MYSKIMGFTLTKDPRLAALWRFAAAISIITILGHAYLGFEQSYAQPLVALATAYTLELLLETISARMGDRVARYRGGWENFWSFILPAHISGLAVSMLLYANDLLWPIALAAAIAVGSKYIFRVRSGNRTVHFLNPSNTGIAATLLIFPWVGIAPPYQYTENLVGLADWALPVFIIISGTYLNYKFTGRMPLILAWLAGFAIQAALRSFFLGTPLTLTLLPMTGMAFILFTFYMVSDPGTTPFDRKGQIIFGFAVAAAYGLLVTMHIVFGIFFALTIVCILRGGWLFAQAFATRTVHQESQVQQPAIAGGD